MSLLILILSVIYFFETGSCISDVLVISDTNNNITEYPFMVSIRNSFGYIMCSGTIIAPRWILTAAHCVANPTNQTTVQYGKTEASVNGTNIASVQRFIKHEEYNQDNHFANDIALLELKDPLIYNYINIVNVTLPKPHSETPQNESYVPGVLVTHPITSVGAVFQKVELNIYSKKECKKIYSDLNMTNRLCAGIEGDFGDKMCYDYGDYGGPLLYNGSIQLGIRSGETYICDEPSHPAVFTEVSHYIDWINNYIHN